MKQVFMILLILAVTVMCQSYTASSWQIDVIIPGNTVIDRVDIFIERTPGTIQMHTGMTYAELMALNPITITQTIPITDSITVIQPYPNSGVFMVAGAIGFDGVEQMTELGISQIIWVPAEYGRITPIVNLIRLP